MILVLKYRQETHEISYWPRRSNRKAAILRTMFFRRLVSGLELGLSGHHLSDVKSIDLF